MAKVKIQGHASGTGILTVTAPNTSTDRTITLPDATGTLATTDDTTDLDGAVTINDSGADVDFRVEGDNKANALFVQGSNSYVGIGSGTPVRPLTIDTQTGTTSLGGDAEVIKIAGSDADETYCGIGFHYDNSDSQTHSPAFMGYQAKNWAGSTNGDLVFATRSGTSDAAPTESMRITADGRGLSQFTAKAWLNYKGTSTNAIRDSHNISSVVDNSTGNYTPIFINNIGADYTVSTSCSYNKQKVGTKDLLMAVDNVGIVTSAMGTTALADADTVMITIFGDN